MHFDFRPLFPITFAELSRKYPYSQTPASSRGRIEGKANTRGIGVWLSQSLTFGNLATAFGVCFLRLQKASLGSDNGRRKDVLQDHGIWLSRSLAFGSSAATYEGCDCPQAPPHRELNQNQTEILECPSPAGPRAAVGGSPLHNDYNRRKFRSETSDNMDSWKAEVRRVRREKIRRKKMQVREKVGTSWNESRDSLCFSNDLWLRRVEK